MIFKPTNIDGAMIIDIEKIDDSRGFFSRLFCATEFKKHGLKTQFVQGNTSLSHQKHTLRGMHFQTGDAEEAKIIRCTKGAILDVVIDLRINSRTYCQYLKVELTERNYRQLYVPEGFAHGFISLTDNTEVNYLVSQFYEPEKETGIRWDDPLFDIQWPTDNPILSNKDRNHSDFIP